MYSCESWDYKESWALKNWCFELWCWRRFLIVPWTTRRSNQSFLKEISPEYSLEGNSNTLATWWEELTHWKRPWCRETLKTGGEEDSRGWDGWMASLSEWTWVWGSSRSWWWTGKPGVLQSMRLQRVGHDWAAELILYWFFCDWLISLMVSSGFIQVVASVRISFLVKTQ